MLAVRQAFRCRCSRVTSNSDRPFSISCVSCLLSFRISLCAGFIRHSLALPPTPSAMTKTRLRRWEFPTLAYKRLGWAIAAFFMGGIGAVAGNMAALSTRKWPTQFQHLASSWWPWRCLAAKEPSGVRFWERSFSMWSKKLLGLSFEPAVDRAWPDPDYQYRLFPAGYHGLAADKVSRAFWHCCGHIRCQ